jgi:hypothetical protein
VRKALVLVVLVSALVSAGVGAGSVVTASVTAMPLAVDLSLSQGQVGPGATVTVWATVRNLGAAALAGVATTLELDAGGLVVDGPVTQQLGTLGGNSAATATWHVCAARAGSYVLLAQGTSGAYSAESPAALLVVASGTGTCGGEASTPGCTAGAGKLATNSRASFAFTAAYLAGWPGPSGAVAFEDKAAHRKLASVRLTSLVIASGHVTLRGDGSVNGARVTFRLDADDGRAQRKADTFTIEWPGYRAAGNVTRGDVAVGCSSR